MKKFLSKCIIAVYCLLLLSASVQAQSKFENYELKQGETIAFHNGKNDSSLNYSGQIIKGAYDGSSFKIKIDKKGQILVSGVRGAKGQHMNDFVLLNCKGNITRLNDTINLIAQSNETELYLIPVKEKVPADVYKEKIEIRIVSVTLKQEYCPTLLNTPGFVELWALPSKVDPEERYKSRHADKTVGVFSFFEIKDKENNIKYYPAGDYVLVGGNKLKFKE